MAKKYLQAAVIVVFLAVLTIPLIQMIHPFVKIAVLVERRTRATLPKVLWPDVKNGSFMVSFNKYFNDNFGFRDFLIRSKFWIIYYVIGAPSNSDVLIGKNGFLFSSATLSDYHRQSFPGERADMIARKIKKIQDMLSERGIKFLFLAAPNPNTIYGEYMPFPSKNPGGKSSLDVLHDSFDRFKVNYLNPVPTFMKEKQNHLLYYKRDIHWNHTAGALVTKMILDKLDPEHKHHGEIYFKYFEKDFNEGCLNIFLGINPEEEALKPVIGYPDTGKKFSKIVIIADSYGGWVTPYLKYFTNELSMPPYIDEGNYSKIASETAGSDIVIFIVMEQLLSVLVGMRDDFLSDGRLSCCDPSSR